MNRLSSEQRERVIACLVEGNSIRGTVRMTGVAKNTVVKLLGDLGLICSIYQDRLLRGLPCQRVQVDEVWSFVYSKQKNVPEAKRGEAGDVWTWVGLDADSKLVVSYHVGGRGPDDAREFMLDLASRLRDRVQLTTDGHAPYLLAVPNAFGDDIDYAMLVKLYGDASRVEQRRYSPARLHSIARQPKIGNPDPEQISTSYVERQNLTMRMGMRRFTRLTNGFSKKLENHVAAISLHFFHYNFCRPHQTLGGKTPAMAAGVTDHRWTISELVGLLSAAEQAVPMKRGPYKRRAA